MTDRMLLLCAALLVLVTTAVVARAETSEVRIAPSYGIAYLPLVVMEQNRLLEKHAKFLQMAAEQAFGEGNHARLDAQTQFTATPQNVMKTALFMHKTGTLKTRPESWKGLFFPEIHHLPGG